MCREAHVMVDQNTGCSRGFGFVVMSRYQDAARAIQVLNGAHIGSRRVRLGWAQHKQDDQSNLHPVHVHK